MGPSSKERPECRSTLTYSPSLQVPADLAEIWNHKSAQQKAVIRLCKAAADGDIEAIKVRHLEPRPRIDHSCEQFLQV